MAKSKNHDAEFEIGFFESVLKREPAYVDVVEILGGLYTKHGCIAAGLKMDRKLVKLQRATRPPITTSRAVCAQPPECRCPALAPAGGGAWLQRFRLAAAGSDLESLKNHPEFVALLEQLKRRADVGRLAEDAPAFDRLCDGAVVSAKTERWMSF